ncbi:MAG: MBL fold metallo-hydrolase [Proteobacteria bacterium]|nr:MBL fold metallo-hydrolase [Pseudomonadota bacterium]MBU4471251.1 MBL fold metallo-hydrolase [Pseudomonadota bacterium]MCG2752852.1 MBL fold metallo-hydrolase [Desulfobacteraceae bacterium]
MFKATPFEDVLQITLCKYEEMVPGAVVSAYLVDGLLIDTGPAHTAEELTDFLAGKTLTVVANTHHHEDHIAANKFLQDRFGVDIFAPPLAVSKINQTPELYPYQEEVWGYPVPSIVIPLGRSISTEKYHFDVISTPGHDRDHICLFDAKNGRLFSGDLFLGTKPVASRPMEDNWQTVEDLKRIRALNPKVIFSASGLVVNDPIQRLDKVIAALEAIGNTVTNLHQNGMTPRQIMTEFFGKEAPIAERTQAQFSSENMVKCFLIGQA